MTEHAIVIQGSEDNNTKFLLYLCVKPLNPFPPKTGNLPSSRISADLIFLPLLNSLHKSPSFLSSHSPLNSGNLKFGTSKKSKTKKEISLHKILNPYLTRILIYLNYESMTAKKTIKEISIMWKEDKRKYVKSSTYSAYALILENHILPMFGDKYE